MSSHATRNGFDGRKCRFMRHEMASTAGNVVSCDTKWLRRPEMPFHATRNGFDGRKCHFMRHETASTVGNAISCDTKRFRRPEMPFLVTRNGQKPLFGRFWRKDAVPNIRFIPPKRWIAAYISLRPYLSGRLLLPPIFQREIYTTDKYDAEN